MPYQIITIARYTLLESLRNRLVWLFALTALAGIGFSGFLAELAITESREIQAALLAGFLRLAAVFLIACFVVTSMAREQHDKGLELLLAMPMPRAAYLLGKLTGFAMLAAVPALMFGLLALLLAPPADAALWSVSLLLELWLVVAFSLLCVLTFSQVMPALTATAAFYLLARSIEALQAIAQAPAGAGSLSQKFMGGVIGLIATVLPQLDQFTRSEWLAYPSGSWSMLPSLLAQAGAGLLLLVGAALFDIYRKNI